MSAFEPTEQQRDVIGHTGEAFVSACPGAGKTKVLVERARLLLSDMTSGQGVAFLSFTNAAMSELDQRLRKEALIGSAPFPHFLGTFDSFLWQFLIAPFGIPDCDEAPRLIPDKDDRLVRPNPGMRELPLGWFDRQTGQINNAAAGEGGFGPLANPGVTRRYEAAALAMRARFRARGELDFADARAVALERIREADLGPRLVAALRARFREVIVDEAQDCNPADLEVINWLRAAGIPTKIICDPDQAIYGFRGGVTVHLQEFSETFGAANQLSMSGNFRSSTNITRAVVAFRHPDKRAEIDDALGPYRDDPLRVQVFSYRGSGVTAAIGIRFGELLNANRLEPGDCPVLAATRQSGARAIGQPIQEGTQDLTLRLATAVTAFHFRSDANGRKAALDDIHQVVLEIEGRLAIKTYHQYLAAEGIEPDAWRPRVLGIARELKFEPGRFANADAWLAHARVLLAPGLPLQGPTINQRLRRNQSLANALGAADAVALHAKTIHAVKGMEFPAVCVVMTTRTSKGIVDYLETGRPPEMAEEARKIYVAASRAQRLLTIAIPRSQAERLVGQLAATGANVALTEI